MALAIVAAVGCSETSNAPRPRVAQIAIALTDTILVPGQATTATSTLRDAANVTISGRTVTWTSANPQVATVDATGVITAASVGSAVVRATAEAVMAEVTVEVRAGGLVDSTGGTVRSGDGRAVVVFPPRTVSTRIAVRIERDATPVPDFRLVPNTAYRLLPSDATLAGPVSLTIQFADAEVPGGVPEALQLFERSGPLWSLTGGVVDTAGRTVRAAVTRPGTFALLGQGPPATIVADTVAPGEERVGTVIRPRVRVLNERGEALRSQPVTYRKIQGDGGLGFQLDSAAVVRTDESGRVSPVWILGNTAGSNVVEAAVPNLRPISFQTRGVAFLTISVGEHHACGIVFGGGGYCWGRNDFRQSFLHGGSITEAPRPVQGVGPFSQISASPGMHSCGILVDGRTMCWGHGTYGQLGDGTGQHRTTPTPVAGTVKFRAISTGALHTCALSDAGDVYCWGSNTYGEVGDGTQEPRLTPTRIASSEKFAAVSTGTIQSCALTVAGAAYCWGDWLSEGWPYPPAHFAPVRVGGPALVSIVTGRDHSCGLTAAGVAWCWGADYAGQAGRGTSQDRHLVPVLAAGGMLFKQLTAGQRYTCGLTPAGVAWCWGVNNLNLGDGTNDRRLSPVLVSGGLVFTSLAAGGATCGVTVSTAAYCWGLNAFGILGDGVLIDRPQPHPVRFP